MTMDPSVRSLVDLLDRTLPRPGELPAAEYRRRHREVSRAARVDGEPVARVEDRAVPGPGGDIPVRVYSPEATEPLPAVVFFHGGGWVICDLDSHDGLCRGIANGAGAAVVSVDYRLAPEHRFPAAVDDCFAATCWVAEHAGELGIDGSRIAVAGDSAGGNLAAAVSLMARDRGGPALAFQLLVYPCLDPDLATPSHREHAEGFFLTRSGMRWYWDQYLGSPEDARHPYAAPSRAPDHSGLPPAPVITAQHDPLRDEGEAYAARLAEAGVAATARRYDGMFHGFFSFGAVLDAARAANDEAIAALRAALVPRGAP